MMSAVGVQNQDSVAAYGATDEERDLQEPARRFDRGFAAVEWDLENGIRPASVVPGIFQTILVSGAG